MEITVSAFIIKPIRAYAKAYPTVQLTLGVGFYHQINIFLCLLLETRVHDQ